MIENLSISQKKSYHSKSNSLSPFDGCDIKIFNYIIFCIQTL